jgi:hypothetical protein
MKGKLLLCLATAGMMLASAKSYSLDLFQPAMAGNTELKAGQYQVELVDQKAVISRGKLHVENAVTVGTADKKFPTTTVVLGESNGKSKIQEIHLGGTNTKLVFAE